MLQELLVPRDVVFYNYQWHQLGRKSGHSELISEMTEIDEGALTEMSSTWHENGNISDAYCVARRMS